MTSMTSRLPVYWLDLAKLQSTWSTMGSNANDAFFAVFFVFYWWKHTKCSLHTKFEIPASEFLLKWHKQISGLFRTFQHHKHQKIRPTVLPLTTFYIVLIRKQGSENVTRNIFCWFITIINAGKLKCKNYSITDLAFQEHTSQIQDFFSTSVQFQDFSGPENPNSNFRTFHDPWEPWAFCRLERKLC